MSSFKSIQSLSQTREEYGTAPLLESTLHPDPIEQFKIWFEAYAALNTKTSNAMVLSTVDHFNHPDSRILLLKKLDKDQFIFYTQYNGVKGLQMEENPFVALNFYWSEQARQVRVRGKVKHVEASDSDQYFYTRPIESQMSTLATEQSKEISGREELEAAYQKVCAEYANKPIVRPERWGGYAVVPDQIEFWQGRDNRLHDRIQYRRHEDLWSIHRLAP